MKRSCSLLVLVLLPGLALAQDWKAATAEHPPFRRTEKRQPCANFQPLRQPFFGELHLHTEYSADAVTLETRNTPADAYRFARGEAVGLPPFVDTRDARQKQMEAEVPGQSPEVSPHPYCLPPQHCEHTATRQVQFPEGRQLDFAAVTDHSEFFGETNICWYEGNKQCTSDMNCADGQFCFGAVSGSTGKCVPNGYSAQPCILGRDEVANLKASSLLGADVFGSYIAAETPKRFPFCKEPGAGGDDTCTFQAKNIWQQIQTDAAAAYDRTSRCSFTSFIAYEYTGTPAMGECVKDANPCFANADCGGHGGICCTSSDTAPGCKELILGGSNNLHRNVIFRNDDVISLPISYIEEPTGCGKGSECQQNQGGALASPQQMLEKLKQECLNDPSHPRCDVLTIPHNSDISGGAMFLLPETFDEASIRREMEPLVELFQIKGGSECRFSEAALWGTTDEMCNFENLDYSKLGGSLIKQPTPKTILPNSYVRNVLKEGLAYQQEHGINPFKLGFVGATDDHNGTPSATEAAMYAKASAHGDVSFVVSGEALNEANFLGLETNGGGITGAWAEENSRDSIFEALKRRETFATSGTRPVMRFFGGFDLPGTMCQTGNFALQGYVHGVPMGGTLSGQSSPPRFAVAAMYDAGSMSGAKLQSAQIIKGWVDKAGETHESVVNVAGNPHNGASVNLRTCKPIGPGFKDLCAVWTDPDFNPTQPAFYYARVLENPSCRWNQYYCNARGVNCSVPFNPEANYTQWEFQQCCSNAVPGSVQQRAWSSPIWYTP